jgi:hypothetical protein
LLLDGAQVWNYEHIARRRQGAGEEKWNSQSQVESIKAMPGAEMKSDETLVDKPGNEASSSERVYNERMPYGSPRSKGVH